MSEDKEYEGTLTLGIVTSTQDRQGEILETRDVPEFSETEIRSAFDAFQGAFEQIPPMVSAIKKDGVPLYKLARKGEVVERKPRPVYVTGSRISRIALPEIEFNVQCSKGFYVRTYAHDIGGNLGCGAHLSALRRTRSGKFTLGPRALPAMDLKTLDPGEILKAMYSLSEISLMRGA